MQKMQNSLFKKTQTALLGLGACVWVVMSEGAQAQSSSDVGTSSMMVALEGDPMNDPAMRKSFDELGIPRSVQDKILEEAMAHLLVEGGLLPRAEDVHQSIVLMERQSRHALAVETMVSLIGPGSLVEVAPGQFADLQGTKAGYRARLMEISVEEEVINARRALLDMQDAQKKQTERLESIFQDAVRREVEERIEADRERLFASYEREVFQIAQEADAEIAAASEEKNKLIKHLEQQVQASAATIIDAAEQEADALLTLANFASEERKKRIAELELELERLETEVANVADYSPPPFGIREIHGVPGQFQAILNLPAGAVRVYEGDRLPGDIRITEITEQTVSYMQNDGSLKTVRY